MKPITITKHANIALIKYWGKRNDTLFLPTKSSLSIGLEALSTTTTISLSSTDNDIIILDGQEAAEKHAKPIIEFLNFFGAYRKQFFLEWGSGERPALLIKTNNTFPTAAGLASSASGFSALICALNKFFNLNLSDKELSILARRGSGSACRSIFNGFVLWNCGQQEDGFDSFADQLYPAAHWPEFRVIIVVVEQEAKKISSRAAMKNSITTSPLYNKWVEDSAERLLLMRQAIKDKNFDIVGQLAEQDCLGMHATMHTSIPAVNFWTPATLNIINLVQILRTQKNISCYFTIDAGPNIKILCQEKDIHKILPELATTPGIIQSIASIIA